MSSFIKNSKEIENITKSSAILAEVKKIIYNAVKPGVTPLEIDKIFRIEIEKRDAKPNFLGYNGFPNSICVSVNDTLIHGIPNDKPFEIGDIVSVDAGCVYKGMNSDSCFTKGVGYISKRDKELIEIAKNSFYAGLNAIKPGARTGDIAFAIQKFVENRGYFLPDDFTGHGIGYSLHEDPVIPNKGYQSTGTLLKNNMVICIEPMILQRSNKVRYMKDGWTIKSKNKLNTSHYEHTILIKDGYPIVLTEGI
ncbi:MAG: type I methionyl aminopeptidase [Mollicutes bacterium PWAP]|nr:type I methionyl aminopeptidase [Mollicutes bacterium PWAP]